jgi:hypothetical protein
MPSTSVVCPCQSLQSSPTTTPKTYCQSCIQATLSQKIFQHKAALVSRNKSRELCSQAIREFRTQGPRFISAQQTIDQFQDQIATMAKDIERMREECGKKSIALASYSVTQSNRAIELDQHRNIVHNVRSNLDVLRTSLLVGDENGLDEEFVSAGSLTSTIENTVHDVKKRRFQLALEAFEMHRMDVGSEYHALTIDDLMEGPETETDVAPSGTHANARFRRLVRQRVPSGIGKIAGLLLPHRGPSHFNGVLPPNVLISSLRLVASLTNLLARCLAIELPHPIVLCPISRGGRYAGMRNEELWLREQTADIVDSVSINHDEGYFSAAQQNPGITLMKDLEFLGDEGEDGDSACGSIIEERRHLHESVPVKSSASTSSLMSLVGSSSKLISNSARRAFDKMKGHHHSSNTKHTNISENLASLRAIISMDQDSVTMRLQHASCAVLYESNTNKNGGIVRYELRPPTPKADRELQRQSEEQFTIGLQLLQNDITALSIKAGVPVAMLWPAEAMFLNLYSLKLHIQHMLSEEIAH